MKTFKMDGILQQIRSKFDADIHLPTSFLAYSHRIDDQASDK